MLRRCLALLVALIALVAFSEPKAAQSTDIAETVRQLREIKLQEEDFPWYEVPDSARPLLLRLKSELRQLIEDTLRTQGTQPLSAFQVRERILAQLNRRGIQLGGDEKIVYGVIRDIVVRRPQGHPDLLAIAPSLGIACGDDSSLYVYRNERTGWSLVLAIEAGMYEEVKGAFGDFKFEVSPPDVMGKWFVVATHVNPWCTSNWHGIHIKVLRPGNSPYKPRELLTLEKGIYIGEDELEKLSVRPNGFHLSYYSGQHLDFDQFIRINLQNYSVRGNSVLRMPPLAMTAEDFLDEWTDFSEEEALRWTDKSNPILVKEWYKKLRMLWKYSSGFEYVQPCDKSSGKILIGLRLDREGRPSYLPPQLNFTVVKRAGAFYIQDINAERPPGCPGTAQPQGSGKRTKLP